MSIMVVRLERRLVSRRVPWQTPNVDQLPFETFRRTISESKYSQTHEKSSSAVSLLYRRERIRMYLRQWTLSFQSTLPLLQKEMSTLAGHSKQSTSQFIAQHEELIFLARESLEQESSPPDEQRKRKLSHEWASYIDLRIIPVIPTSLVQSKLKNDTMLRNGRRSVPRLCNEIKNVLSVAVNNRSWSFEWFSISARVFRSSRVQHYRFQRTRQRLEKCRECSSEHFDVLLVTVLFSIFIDNRLDAQ